MAMTAFEQNRHLNIDLGDGTMFTVPPIPGRIGKRLLGLLVQVSFGTNLETADVDAEELAAEALGKSAPGWEEREALYETLRASEQAQVAQAAIVWNVQGGSIDAVHDLLNTEAGEAYPKALARVMESCGLGPQFNQLRQWLNGVSVNPTPQAFTEVTTGQSGISNTNGSETIA